MIIYKMHVK